MKPAEWKAHYARERAGLDLERLFERAPSVAGDALVFPHVHLADAGHQVAAVARAVVRSGREEVLALGVLHGGRDRPQVRGVQAAVADEFSLDGFAALLEVAARLEGRRAPRLHARYPFLVGDDPRDLPGLEELLHLRDRGAAIVATADPVHHGVGYGTPDRVARAAAPDLARRSIEESLRLLATRDFAGFQRHAREARSDFRDAGPVLATLVPFARWEVHDLVIADYAATLGAAEPTWVAAALVSVRSSEDGARRDGRERER